MMQKVIQSLIAFSLKNHLIVFFLTFLLLVAGIISYVHTPIEAYPDVTNTRARVITQWPGRSAEEVEKFVTLPLMRELNTIPRKTDVRSISLFGLSVVTVLFEDDVDDFYAQQYAANRLQSASLPEGVSSEIEPPSGATGEIFRYVIKSKRPIKEITSLQDWVVERELVAVPGVSNVVSFGGEEKIYEIKINPTELANYNLSPLDVFEAVSKSNVNVGGDIIQKGDQAYVVRGIGLLNRIEDIENILIDVKGKTPILVKNVAKVEVSAKPRLGQVGLQEDKDVVQGIVMMLRGEDPAAVIARLKDKIAELNNEILPKDVKIVPIVDRMDLVNTTVSTVSKNLLEGILFVSIVVFIFLFNWRTTVIVASVIPLSFLFAIIMLRIQGLSANLISIGAIDFGLLLEGTLVIVEAIFVAMVKKQQQLGAARFALLNKSGLIKKSAGKVAGYIVFSQLILIIALIPILSFQKVEGKMFAPLAFTLGYALLGSLLLSVTYVPALCKLLMKSNIRESENIVARFFNQSLFRLYLFSNRFRRLTIFAFVTLLVVCTVRFIYYGSEFIPKLNEGSLYVRATLPNSVNLSRSVALAEEMKAKIRSFKEVKFVLNQVGRPNDGTDPTGFFNIEFNIDLYPEKKWKSKLSKEALVHQIRDSLSGYPGIVFSFSQPIQDNVEEFVAGVKSSLVVKIFGDDLFKLEDYAQQVANSLQKVKGIEGLTVYKNIGLPELRIQLHDHKMARYGVDIADAQAVIEMAIGGRAATKFYENDRQFDIRIRFEKQYRDSDIKIGELMIPAKDGNKIPLKELATIGYFTGPAYIYREGSSRYIAVGFSIEGRDLGTTIAEAKSVVAAEVKIPSKNKMIWAGEFESKERATRQLALIVPGVLLLILILLYFNFSSIKDTAVAAATIPFAFIGGFISLWLTNTVFGISAGISFIILFGVNTINSIILIAVIKDNLRKRMPLATAISNGIRSRIRPIIMIALMGSMGLLPAAASTGMGSEIQKPLAIMIVGGLIICMVLSLTVLPQLVYFAYKRKAD